LRRISRLMVEGLRLSRRAILRWLNLFSKPIWIVVRSATLSSW